MDCSIMSGLVGPAPATIKRQTPFRCLFFYNYDRKDSNLRTSFQEASPQGEADWENNPVDCSIMSGLFGPA